MGSIMPEGSDSLWGMIGLFLGGSGVGIALVKMSDRVIDRLLTRAEKRDERKETAETRLREELRDDNERLIARISALSYERDEISRKERVRYQASVMMETENKLLRAAHLRMRAYLIYQQEELRKALGLKEAPILGIPAWIDDNIPGPTAPNPNVPLSPLSDPGKQVLLDDN